MRKFSKPAFEKIYLSLIVYHCESRVTRIRNNFLTQNDIIILSRVIVQVFLFLSFFLSFFLISIPFETKNIPPIIREESVEERLDPS